MLPQRHASRKHVHEVLKVPKCGEERREHMSGLSAHAVLGSFHHTPRPLPPVRAQGCNEHRVVNSCGAAKTLDSVKSSLCGFDIHIIII